MEIALVVLSIISLSFMIAYVAVVKKLKTVSDGFAQLLVAYSSMSTTLESTQSFASSPEDQDIHKENFIKFLSDSRDWAYDYIENVQSEIKLMKEQIGSDIEYYEKYGEASKGMFAPYDSVMPKFCEVYRGLEKMIPEDIDDRR